VTAGEIERVFFSLAGASVAGISVAGAATTGGGGASCCATAAGAAMLLVAVWPRESTGARAARKLRSSGLFFSF